jgi:hypothetical protein
MSDQEILKTLSLSKDDKQRLPEYTDAKTHLVHIIRRWKLGWSNKHIQHSHIAYRRGAG